MLSRPFTFDVRPAFRSPCTVGALRAARATVASANEAATREPGQGPIAQSGRPLSERSQGRPWSLRALRFVVLYVGALMLTTGVAACGDDGEARVAADNDRVTVHYRGTLDSGEEFDSSRGGDPFGFVVGTGQVIAGFDDAVRGLAVGETVTVRIEAAQAYGEHSDDRVIEVPLDQAPPGLAEGDRVTVGSGTQATVLEVTETAVRLDTNHPLAGQALTFEIELLSVE